MTRPPAARNKILEAAERIVKEHGAGKLTYEELVQQSGVSRGGITYHFATKDDLLRALLERDVEQWLVLEARERARLDDEPAADLIARIRAWANPDPEKRRFVAGMLSAVALDRSLLAPVRAEHAKWLASIEHDDAEARRCVLRLAAEGLFWSELFECSVLPEELRKRVMQQIESLAREWTDSAAQPPLAPKS